MCYNSIQMEQMAEKQIEILRKKSTAERLKLAFDLYDFARLRVETEIIRQNPNLPKNEIKKILRKRFSR